jgi:hypothetical protein
MRLGARTVDRHFLLVAGCTGCVTTPSHSDVRGTGHLSVFGAGALDWMKVSMVRGSSALWLFLSTYALLYSAFGVQSPFVPALLGERGLPAEDIGLVLAAAMVVRVLVGPLVSHAADRLRRHTSILCGCALFAALATISFLFARNLAGLLCVALLPAATLLRWGRWRRSPMRWPPGQRRRAGRTAHGGLNMVGCALLDLWRSRWARWQAAGRPERPDSRQRSGSAVGCWF